MKRKLLGVSLLVLLVTALVLTGCSSGGTKTAAKEDSLADGVLSVGVDDTYLPMEFRNDQNELVGFDIDFANALAEQLGVSVEFQTVAWDGIFNGLNAKQYDAIISSTSITPDRLKGFSMTDPYVANGIVIVSRKDATPVKTFKELEGKTLGAQIETTADIAAEKLKTDENVNVEIKKFDGMLDAFAALQGKQIDNVITDAGVAMYYVAQNPDLFVVSSDVLTNEPIGVTSRIDDTATTEKLNEAIKALQKNGKLSEISMKWFGKDMTKDIDTKLVVIE
ncbi:transporter substrate-binding domain-containing protein [Acetobacterium woodii]|uniref:Glutamine ABC transport system substrate binding protein GlnH2 n=1 Tax=Acetobacterium woodii (strain ATCC 29683 / DSM 1030 / JCM 2381 / KCTC 1655 / WB1) TaxID=931626 RepID=H6LF55_ACEWD|nr:transporter substrate-binding domain-containing protein [Acetobacterium woodii]AFA48155.1 glutamine ABC transport system substrate binding protein GlnH2 [Acetobacterium woodii DSM 1030]